jgi:hypothetical protein
MNLQKLFLLLKFIYFKSYYNIIIFIHKFIKSDVILFTSYIGITLLMSIYYYYISEPLLLQPSDGFDPLNLGYTNYSESSLPPAVNYSTKPTGVVMERACDAYFEPNRYQIYELPTNNTPQPISHNIAELGVNYPNTSSVLTNNNSIPSNIHEMDNSNTMFTNNPHNSHMSNSPILNTNSSILAQNGSTITLTDKSINSSMIVENGIVDTPYRFNADDYSTTHLNDNINYTNNFNPVIHSNNDNLENIQVGFLAPTPDLSPQYDYTEREIPKEGIVGKIILGFKSFDSKIEGVYVKYHAKARRKFFWEIWEKNKSRYESYEDFRSNWDPNSNIWTQIRQESKINFKNEFESALGLNRNNRGVNRGMSRDIEELIRKNRPFGR